jgi:hypothetical protein
MLMKTAVTGTVRNYWLVLAGMLGLTVGVVATASWPWPVITGAALILVAVLYGSRHRQLSRDIRRRFAGADPGAGVIGSIFGAAAVLLRSTPAALWAGPLLGVAAFVGMSLYLTRYGSFSSKTGEAASESS